MDDAKSGTAMTHPLLHLATSPVNWNNNDLPGWRPVTPFPAILEEMLAAGYGATEYDASFGQNATVLRTEASQRATIWCGAYQWVDFLATDSIDEAISDLEPTLLLLSAIDCRHLIVADALRPHRVALAGRVASDGSDSLDAVQVRRIAESVHRLSDAASRHGIAVHYHNHVGTWVETPRELEALMECLDPGLVSLCFDTGHYAYGGGDPAAFIREHHARIGYMHLKDVDPAVLTESRRDGLTFLDALRRYVFCPIGEGSADIPAILGVLATHAFPGWIVVEQDTCMGDSTATARANLEFITRWLEESTGRARVHQGGQTS